ncbi:unnamed protein product, partial [Rotaria sordida]
PGGVSPTSLGEYCSSTSNIVHESKKNGDKNMSNLKHKRRKHSHDETLSTTLLHLSDNTDHESNDSENELPVNDESRGHTNQLSTTATPKFAGHCVVENNEKCAATIGVHD